MRDDEIIDALGGTCVVARLCEVSPSAVSQWRKNGIPRFQRRYLALILPEAFAEAVVVPDTGALPPAVANGAA